MTPIKVGLFCLLPLAGFLLVAAWHDIRSHRIPNYLVLGGSVLGLILNTVTPPGIGFLSELPGGTGLIDALAGLAIGLAVMLPLYFLRAMGAGDIKLMAMTGAFLGPREILGAILGTFVAGGVLALVFAIRAGILKQVLQNIRIIIYAGASKIHMGTLPILDDSPNPAGKMPYAIAIASGTFGYLAWTAYRMDLGVLLNS